MYELQCVRSDEEMQILLMRADHALAASDRPRAIALIDAIFNLLDVCDLDWPTHPVAPNRRRQHSGRH